MSKKRRAGKPAKQSKQSDKPLIHSEYGITWDPIPDPRLEKLPEEAQEVVARLHDEAQTQPEKAIPELLEMIRQYPDLPMLYNYLSNAYAITGRNKEADATIQETIQRFPDYLFGRLNYAERCLAKGDLKRVPEIFGHKLDLKLLYPQREVFHISEVVGFMGIMGLYFAKAGERHAAELYYGTLRQLEPDHPLTLRLGNVLHPGALQRLIQRLKDIPPR